MVWDVRFYLSTSCRISSHKDWDQSKNGRERWRNTSLLWSCSVPIRSWKMRKEKGWINGVGSEGFFVKITTKQIQPPNICSFGWGGERNWQLMTLVVLGWNSWWTKLQVAGRICSPEISWFWRLVFPIASPRLPLIYYVSRLGSIVKNNSKGSIFFSNLIIYNK